MTEPIKFSKVMVIVDGSESGIRAARFAIRFAAAHKATVYAVAAVDTASLRTLLTSSVLVEAEVAEFDKELEGSAQVNLNYTAQMCKEGGVTCEVLLKKGSAHSAISDEVRAHAPDLLVMGSFTSTMIKRDLNARVRRLVVDEAQCPILLVP